MSFSKIAIAVPKVHLGDISRNMEELSSLISEAAAQGAEAIVFPPMALSGATCGDLARQSLFKDAAGKAEDRLREEAAALGIIPVLSEGDSLEGVEVIREAVPETVVSHSWRLAHYASESKGKLLIYCSAGYGESTGDGVYSGDAFAFEDGRLTAQSERFSWESQLIYAVSGAEATGPVEAYEETSPTDPHPFIPENKDELGRRCGEILSIQSAGLASRMEAINCKSAVIGISGGLDSTLAVLVTCLTFDKLGLDRKDIIAVTMPGFGTTDRTYTNALDLMKALGTSIREIPIGPAVLQHFKDIDHPADLRNAAYENAQARERTQILMDIANDTGGIVIGTGDLSEIALGWCTYNGDHMSMYGVNCDVPKTLVQAVVRHAAETTFRSCGSTLLDILDTPISPELLPGENGAIKQKTEDLVGPYELHDFFLYHFVRHGRRPSEIRELAVKAFEGAYGLEEVDKWLRKFIWRFFSQQFKRSCSPDGPRIGSVCLSPRGAWSMPPDITPALWIADLDGTTGR